MFRLLQRLFFWAAGRRFFRLFLLMGLLILIPTVGRMVQTAKFVWKAEVVTAVVTDVRQHPFTSTLDALLGGNLSTSDSTAYIPTLRFTLPCGTTCTREPAIEDNRDYRIGEEVNVLTYAVDPTQVRPYRFKFLWGGDCVRAAAALLCLLLGRLLHGPFFRRRPARQQEPRRAPQPERPAELAPAAPAAEKPKKPRTRKKKEPTAAPDDTPKEPKPKKPRSRKKKTPRKGTKDKVQCTNPESR